MTEENKNNKTAFPPPIAQKRKPGRPKGTTKKLPVNFSAVMEDINRLAPDAVATLGKFVKGKIEGQSALDQRAAAIQVLKFMQDYEAQQKKDQEVSTSASVPIAEEGVKTPFISMTASTH